MTPRGAIALKAAVRRSLPLIIGLIVLAVIAVNAFKQIQGPRWGAETRLLISSTPIANAVTGVGFVDAERMQQTALGIAGAPEIYEEAARKTKGEFGTAADLEAATTVSGDPSSDLIAISADTADPDRSIGIANAVADAYIDYRDQLTRSEITETLEGLQERIGNLPESSPGRAELEAQAARLEVAARAPSDTEVIQPATEAVKTSPNPLRDSIVGLSIGLVIALLAAAIREAIDTRVRSEGDVEDVLSVPVLATVPALPRRVRLVTYGRHEASFADTYALLAAQLIGGEGEHEEPKVYAVTSAVAEEGKTTTAANLAVSVARRGKRVILADFDFRKPSIAALFGIPGDAQGALQVMSGKAAVGESLWTVALDGPRPTVSLNGHQPDPDAVELRGGVSGTLRVLPCGGMIPARSLPARQRIAALLRDLRARADVVIVDTPPALLTVEVSEISKLVDAVLLVVREGHVTERNLRALSRQSQGWGAEVAGAVVTDTSEERRYSYYGGS